MEKLSLRGIVLRVTTYKESDRICVLLTDRRGIISARARGAQNINNKNFAATTQFAYGSFELTEKNGFYYIDESSFEELSVKLREDLESLCLAQYLCEIIIELSPRESVSEAYIFILRLALFRLVKGDRSRAVIKAATELRLLSLAGYMPDVVMCSGCGVYESELMYFHPVSGIIRCKSCGALSGEPALPLSRAALSAMRYIIYSEPEKVLSFNLKEPSLSQLAAASERYLTAQTDRGYKTLELYKSVCGD